MKCTDLRVGTVAPSTATDAIYSWGNVIGQIKHLMSGSVVSILLGRLTGRLFALK